MDGLQGDQTFSNEPEMISVQPLSKETDIVKEAVATTIEASNPEIVSEIKRMQELLARPRLAEVAEWDFTTEKTWLLADLVAYTQRIVREYHLASYTVCAKLEVITSSFVRGCGLFFADCRPDKSTSGALFAGLANSGFHHLPVDYREQNEVTIKFPWLQPNRSIKTTGDPDAGHQFKLVSIVPGESGTTGETSTVKLWVWLEDVSLRLPRAQSGNLEFGHPNHSGLRNVLPNDRGFEALVERPTALQSTIVWDANSLPGELLATIKPWQDRSRLSNIASYFDRVRGDCVVQLMVSKTPFHRGQLTLRVDSSGSLGDGGARSVVWDIGKSSTMCVRMKWAEVADMLSRGNTSTWLQLYVTGALKYPEQVASDVHILTYVHAENFRCEGPTVSAHPVAPLQAVEVIDEEDEEDDDEDYVDAGEAQGWMLQCEEGIEDLVAVEQPVVGKTLTEIVHQFFPLGHTDPTGGTASTVYMRPFSLRNTATDFDLLSVLLSNFAFYEGYMEVEILTGDTVTDAKWFDTATRAAWHYRGRVNAQVYWEYSGSTIVGAITQTNFGGPAMNMVSGQTSLVKVHADPRRMNNYFQDDSSPALVLTAFDKPNSLTTSSLPAMFVNRRFNGTPYGLVGYYNA